MKKEELDKILELHKIWLNKKKGGVKADLSGAELSGADLYGANLRRADLREANLRNAYLRNADLRGVNLRNADLRGVNLRNADLREANLSESNLNYANLCNAVLCNADLFNANLCNADLCYANLNNADLCDANLRKADLQGANLDNIEVNYSTIGYHLSCPESGSFVGFKKLKNGLIAKIEIPTFAKRSSATTRKCRAEFVKVLEITDKNGNKFNKGCTIFNFIVTVYDVGKITRADSWDENRWKECSNGIHFFLTKEEAIDW